MTKKFISLAACALLASCAYTYELPSYVDATARASPAVIKFDNRIKMRTIDDRSWSPKFSIWVAGSHEVKLAPGEHTFRFTYNAVSANGGYYTVQDTVLTRHLEAGKNYELQYRLIGSQVFFAIREQVAATQASDEPSTVAR